MKAVTFGVYSLGMSSTTSATIAKKVTDLFGFTKPSPYQDQDLWDITNKIVSQTAGGGRRLLFCHSQGNLYCNLVYDQLIARGVAAKTIGLVGLAVPYSSLKTGNVYTTSVNDVVIDAVRKATLSTILSTTLTIPYAPTIDALGHNLIRTYFANSGARDQITTNITNEFGTLKSEYPAIQWPGVTYANTLYSWCQGCVYWNGVAWVLAQPTYKWINLGPFPQSYITVWPGTLASAMSQASVNGQACYGFAVAEIKAQRLLGNTGFVSMFPKYYGCWEVAGNDPATSFNPSAWWLYGGDLPPAWRVIHDVQSGKVRAEGGARCTI